MDKKKDIKNIISKYIKGNSKPEELQDTFKIFEEPYQNLNLRGTLFEIWNEQNEVLDEQNASEDFSTMLHQIHHRINLERKEEPVNGYKKWTIGLLKVAAILITGLLIGLLVNRLNVAEPLYYTSIAPKGSVSQMILPDNTMVYLNSGSRIKYSLKDGSDRREVYLDGEAWFDVTRNVNQPFVVHTSYYDVKVLGTQFNVKAYTDEDEVATTLERGKVLITSSDNFKINGEKSLNPGEQLVYNKVKKIIEVKNVNPRIFTSWKDNKLIFINMSLKELIVLLERKFGVDIEVADNIVLDYHYDGTIKDETILEVLDLLKETLPIRYSIDGQKIIILKK